jgi:hypothetical protein
LSRVKRDFICASLRMGVKGKHGEEESCRGAARQTWREGNRQETDEGTAQGECPESSAGTVGEREEGEESRKRNMSLEKL